MVCPKCGSEIEEGKLYCSKCGEEIRIVPDFVPEIDLKIEDTLQNVANELDDREPSGINGDTVNLDIPIIEEEHKKLPKAVIAIVAGVFVILLICLGFMIYHDNSAAYQMKLGDNEYSAGNLREASEYYKNAIKLSPDDITYSNRLADCYVAMNDPDMACQVYMDLIYNDPDCTMAYTQIVAIYESNGEYDKIAAFLGQYGNDVMRDDYIDYLALQPTLGEKPGEYDQAITLSIADYGKGNIYYTMDGSEPDNSSTQYNAPISLSKGEYQIKAIFQNAYGVYSDITVGTYDIMANAPDAPAVSLQSGDYTSPQLITVTVPLDTTVYYTTDGSEPSTLSYIYGEPIALPEGGSEYRFVAINAVGVKSEIVDCTYNLNVECAFTADAGLELLVNKLVDIGYLVDNTGTLANYPGKYVYMYGDMRSINGISLYCYNEYYATASTSRDMTSNIFGVDMLNGNIYRVIKSVSGVYTIRPMQ